MRTEEVVFYPGRRGSLSSLCHVIKYRLMSYGGSQCLDLNSFNAHEVKSEN